MVEKAEIALYISAKEEASKVLKQVEQQVGLTSQQIRQAGVVITAAGAGITAALGFAAKAALDDDINVRRLATTLENAGTAYDDVKESLEGVITATQRKTGVADDEQRDILNRLILTTGDYAASLELLPTVLDLAAAGEMDATTAATYLGKAHNELADGADEVSIRFGQASLQFSSMADIQDRVKGAAENLANPLDILKAEIGDIAEGIGASLLPMLRDAVGWFSDAAASIKDWIDENPKLVQTIVMITGGIGGLMLVVGPLLIALGSLSAIAGGLGIGLGALLGPIGWVMLAITGLITVGTLLWQNWDKVKSWFADLWDNIKIIFSEAVKFLVNTILQPFFLYVDKVFGTILGVLGEVVGFFNKDWGDAIQSASDTLHNLDNEIVAWADNLGGTSEANKKYRDQLEAINEKERELEKAAADAAATNKLLGDSFDEAGSKLDDYGLVIETVKMSFDELSYAAANYQTAVGSVEEQQEALIKQFKRVDESFEQMMNRIWYTRSEAAEYNLTMYDMYDAMEKLGYGVDDIRRQYHLWGDDISMIEQALEYMGLTAADANSLLQSSADAATEALQQQKDAVDELSDAISNVPAIPSSRPAAGAVADPNWPVSQEALSPQYDLWDAYRAEQANGADANVQYMNALRAAMQHNMDVLYGGQPGNTMTMDDIPKYANGGEIPEPTLLYGLSSRRVYAMAGENGREYVTPGGGNITIPIYMDGRQIARYVIDAAGQKAHLQGA